MNFGERLELIERLGRLHAEGALSDDEFASEKSKLLSPSPTRNAAVVEQSRPSLQHDSAVAPASREWRARVPYEDGTKSKWIGGLLTLILLVAGGYWFVQSSVGVPQDALTDRDVSVSQASAQSQALTGADDRSSVQGERSTRASSSSQVGPDPIVSESVSDIEAQADALKAKGEAAEREIDDAEDALKDIEPN